jgi:hypothetical protein
VAVPDPSAPLARLADRLQVDPDRLAFLDRLDEPAVEEFATQVEEAMDRDQRAIEEGLQETLRFVPRLLRGRAKKMLFPEDDT